MEGDYLFPFLFILVKLGLGKSIKDVVEENKKKGCNFMVRSFPSYINNVFMTTMLIAQPIAQEANFI
jgi:hypothetical protein